LIYRENYGGEIGSKRWLKQFIGMTEPKNYVDGISGATISVNSMKYSINKLIKSL
jgi:Na+-transporting NADH:ubiquinone oxidoreductase subunit NqrC